MKKILGLSVLLAATASLSACNGWSLPKCYDELNECDRGLAYTEERTAQANPKRQNWAKGATQAVPEVVPMPEPEPMPVAEPAPAPAPEPEPAPIIMQSAEPQFNQISK